MKKRNQAAGLLVQDSLDGRDLASFHHSSYRVVTRGSCKSSDYAEINLRDYFFM
jgi:hypothetical protein